MARHVPSAATANLMPVGVLGPDIQSSWRARTSHASTLASTGDATKPATQLGMGPDKMQCGGAIGHATCLRQDFTMPTPTASCDASAVGPFIRDPPSPKTILAIITASDGLCTEAPVVEFRLKPGGDAGEAITACHRVRAYFYNQARIART